MEFAGIITEYDPFHNGHAAQIAAAKSAGAGCVAVCMSSGAVQRGGVPVLPESVRVCAALDAGADLVITLPAPYACATAEQFASAGVRLLAALGCDTLVFGAEDPDAAQLSQVAELLARPELDALLRERLSTGMTYAAARAEAADALLPGAGTLLRTPNNILGIEYCKAILAQGAALTPLALPRLGAAHGGGRPGEHNGIPMASASYLRSLTVEDWEPYVPPRAAALYTRAAAAGLLTDGNKFEVAVLALLRATRSRFCRRARCERGAGTPPGRCRAGGHQPGRPVHPPKDKTLPPCAAAAAGAGRCAGHPRRAACAALHPGIGGTQNCAVPFKAGRAARRDQFSRPGTQRGGGRKNQRIAQQSCRFFGTLQGQNPADGTCLYDQTRGNIKHIWRNARRTVRLLHF